MELTIILAGYIISLVVVGYFTYIKADRELKEILQENENGK